ncbi:hypothetical protein BU17DRAFT_61074 [Hysterangium stoloniferum]|nr:hypothetical protein BU17DRAFT_61074 [Hysterangium stoloniferum]
MMVWIPTISWKDGGPRFSPFMPKRQQKVRQQIPEEEEDDQSAVEQNDFSLDLDFEPAHLSTGEADLDDRVAVNKSGKILGGSQPLTSAKRSKHVLSQMRIFEKAKAAKCKPEKNKRTPYVLENDEDWLHIIAEYRKAVGKKGDDTVVEIKFPDKFLQQFSTERYSKQNEEDC